MYRYYIVKLLMIYYILYYVYVHNVDLIDIYRSYCMSVVRQSFAGK